MATEEELKKKFTDMFAEGTQGATYSLLKLKDDGTVDMEHIENIMKEGGPKAAQVLREFDYWYKNVADNALKDKSFNRSILEDFGGGIGRRNNMIFASATAQLKSDEAAGFGLWKPGARQPDDQAASAAQEAADKKVLEQDATDKFILAAQRADIVRPSFGASEMFSSRQPEGMLAPGLGAYKPKRNGILKARGIL